MSERIAPATREEFRTPISQMMDEDRRLPENQPPALPKPVALPFVRAGKYRFRTKIESMRKRFEIPLLIPHMSKDNPEWDAYYTRYKHFIDRQIRQGKLSQDDVVKTTRMLKRDVAVLEELGVYVIKFAPVRKTRECIYSTDSAVVADYIRWRMARGEFPDIVEDIRPLTVVVDGVEIPVFPATDEGHRVLAGYLASQPEEVEPLTLGGSS